MKPGYHYDRQGREWNQSIIMYVVMLIGPQPCSQHIEGWFQQQGSNLLLYSIVITLFSHSTIDMSLENAYHIPQN